MKQFNDNLTSLAIIGHQLINKCREVRGTVRWACSTPSEIQDEPPHLRRYEFGNRFAACCEGQFDYQRGNNECWIWRKE
jgi:hypothetical protein